MISPPYLTSGDTVAIVAPARKVSPAEMEPAIGKFREWGYKVHLGEHLYGACNQYSGSDTERLSDLQSVLDDPAVKAVFAARGGYGTMRIIDQLDFSRFKKNPKWIVGFSDVTVLHAHLHNLGFETLHAAMPLTFPADSCDNEAILSLKNALSGNRVSYEEPVSEYSVKGTGTGMLTGGNLSILYAVNGSASDVDTKGKILFIEDLDEYLYHIDRMMINLKRSGKLSGLKGLIVGGMTQMNDNTIPFGKTAEQIVAEAVSEYGYPVCFGFPAGHQEKNLALILGREVSLQINDSGCRLDFNV